MSDKYMQVPVSLIEGLLDDFGNRRARAKRDAQARLDSIKLSPDDGLTVPPFPDLSNELVDVRWAP